MKNAKVKKTLESRLVEIQEQIKFLDEAINSEAEKGIEDSQYQDKAVQSKLKSKLLLEIKQIEAAIFRIEEGTYGECIECGAKINKKRLKAMPYTLLCIDCIKDR